MPTISEHDALPTGCRLAEFEIQQVLGIGGFGVVYLAFDHALERQVAIKEYMPAALASRGFGAEVAVRSASHVDTFMLGMRSFINEARLLARFDHPSLVKVYRFWEQHGTAYMVMPYYKGRTLEEIRRDMTRPPDEAWLRRLITPLLGALECLHRENVYHRDVAPDNILLLDDESGPGRGHPVLLDLGAARRVIGDHTQTLTAIVKPSFAPIEQYAETVQLRQGPWTDLYALAAVVHFCITGRPPMPATVRTVHDDVATLRQMSAGLATGYDCHFSAAFAHAIDHALAVRPQDRPESVAAWRDELNGSVAHPLDEDDAALEPKSAQWMAETVLLRATAADEEGQHAAGQAFAEHPVYMTTIPAAGRLNAPPAWPPLQADQTVAKTFRLTPGGGAHAVPVPGGQGGAGAPAMPAMSEEATLALRHVMAAALNAIPPTVPIARPATARSAAGALGGGVDVALDGGLPAETMGGGPAKPGAPSDPVQPAVAPIPVTHPLKQDEPAPRVSPASVHPWAIRHSPPWLRWSFGMLALMMALAIWWSHVRGQRQAEVISASEAAGLTASTSLSRPPSPTGDGAGGVNAGAGGAQAAPAGGGGAGHTAGRGSQGPQGAAMTDAASAGKPVDGRERASRQEPAAGPLNPRRACGDRSFIMLAICMKRYCSRPEYTGHGECARMREQEERQRGNYYP